MYVQSCIHMYVYTYVCDPVRLRLRHLYQVEFCSFIVRYPTAGTSVYCGHISMSCYAIRSIQVAKWLVHVLPARSEVPVSNPAEGVFQFLTVWHFMLIKVFIINLLLSQYDNP